jgi:hypothetical protein
MLISYYDDRPAVPHRTPRRFIVLLFANVLVAFALLFQWTLIVRYVEGPLSWATWMPVTRGSDLLSVLDYPFVAFWLMPIVGAFVAWVGVRSGRLMIAYVFASVPLIMLALILGWYHLSPIEWQ